MGTPGWAILRIMSRRLRAASAKEGPHMTQAIRAVLLVLIAPIPSPRSPSCPAPSAATSPYNTAGSRVFRGGVAVADFLERRMCEVRRTTLPTRFSYGYFGADNR